MIKFHEKKNSEIIVNSIINKIISLSITQSINTKFNRKIPEKCFSYVKESINNFINLFYIFYDREEERNIKEKEIFKSEIEGIENDNNNKVKDFDISSDKNNSFLDNIFYKNSYNLTENNWDLMDEPVSSNLDRYATTLIKFEERNLGIESKYKINQEKIIEEDENNYDENKNTQNIQKRSSKLKSTIINLYRKNSKFYNNNEENNKNRKKSEMNQLKTIDLEPEKNYENKQIAKLRIIFEKKEKEKEKEELINKEAKEKMKYKLKVEESNLRKYIGKKINKDHNGQIIFIKSIKPEKFKKEFIFTNSKSKMVTIHVNNNSKPKLSPKEELKDVQIEKKEENEKKEKALKMAKIKNRRFKYLNSIDANNKNNELQPISLKKNIPLITSGSNFHLMNMEVGVSIKEDEKYKTGGLDFFSRYKKFSVEVYNKKLKESENSNNLMKNIEILSEPKTKTIEEIHNLYKTNYTLGTSTFEGNNSINLNTDSNIYNKKVNNNMMYLTNSNNNSSIFKNYVVQANMSTYKPKNILNLTPVINTKSGASSLINSFSNLNLVSKGNKSINAKNKNLFRAKIIKQVNKYMLDDMNTFTKNLLLNQKDNKFNEKLLMKTTGKIRGVSNPGKPDMREIIQEVGLKGKNMRSRTKFPPLIKSNFLDNENFFKQ